MVQSTSTTKKRKGLRIRGRRANKVVHGAMLRFAKWLRAHEDFPMRLPVYLLPGKNFITSEGEESEASFFAPFERTTEPYIRISTGDYPALRREVGRDNALARYIHAFCRQLVRYRQWLATGTTENRGIEKQANAMLRRYNDSVIHP